MADEKLPPFEELYPELRGPPPTRSSYDFHRPDLRYRRAQSLAHAIRQEIEPFLERGADQRPLMDKLFALCMQRGVEVLTDADRATLGLPARTTDGWTAEEIIALEQQRLKAMYEPMPPLLRLNKEDAGS